MSLAFRDTTRRPRLLTSRGTSAAWMSSARCSTSIRGRVCRTISLWWVTRPRWRTPLKRGFPFWISGLVEFVESLPVQFKLRNGSGKYLHKSDWSRGFRSQWCIGRKRGLRILFRTGCGGVYGLTWMIASSRLDRAYMTILTSVRFATSCVYTRAAERTICATFTCSFRSRCGIGGSFGVA